MLMLKLDCRVKSAVRHPCHPVSCFNCKCKLRRLFYRCIECSQKSCVGTGGGINGEDRGSRHVDFCPDCFVRMSDVHKTHHFLTSDASIEMVQEVTWHPAKNPLVSTLPPAHLTALQTRELTVNDYDLLLQLDSSPEKSIVNALLDALPSVSREVVTAAPTKYKGGGCVCDSDSSQLMVLMPCGHVMHRQCLKQDIACLAEEDLASLGDYRCTHEGCGKGVFFCLRRRKKRSLPNPGASSSGKAETEASKADKNRHLMDSSTRPQITMLPSIVGAALVGQGTSGGGGGIGNLMPVDNAILRQALQSRSHTQPRVRRHTADNTRLAPSLTLEAGRSYTAEASAVLPSVSLGKTLIGKRTPRGIGTLRSTGKPPLTSSFPLALEAVPLLHTQENILNAHRNDSSEMLVSVSARGFEDVRARGKIGVGFGVGAGGGGGLSGNGGGTIGRSFAGIGGVGMGPGFGGLSHGGSSGDMHGGGHGERDGEGLRVVSSSIMRSTSDLDLQGLSTTMMDSMRMPPVRRPPMLTRPTPASIRRSLVATEVENSDSLNQLLVVNYR
ncbi:hypothetical protein EON65_13130 [archaeon]|nr:MAG: hypothetical protein EON65_13130 [archaeon]